MSEEIAIKICEQMIEDVESLCECPRFMEEKLTCVGCRELAIKTILQENKQLKEKQELHLNRIDELTERVVNLKSVIDEVNEEIFNYLISEDYCSAEYKDLPDFLLKINRIIGSVVVKGGNNE